jgi:hypothetical protein
MHPSPACCVRATHVVGVHVAVGVEVPGLHRLVHAAAGHQVTMRLEGQAAAAASMRLTTQQCSACSTDEQIRWQLEFVNTCDS